MNDSEDIQQRLAKLEAEVQEESAPFVDTSPDNPQKRQAMFKSIQNWYETLPTIAKVGAIALGIVVGLALLNMVLRIVAATLTLLVLGIAGYVVYQLFFVKDDPQ